MLEIADVFSGLALMPLSFKLKPNNFISDRANLHFSAFICSPYLANLLKTLNDRYGPPSFCYISQCHLNRPLHKPQVGP